MLLHRPRIASSYSVVIACVVMIGLEEGEVAEHLPALTTATGLMEHVAGLMY